MASALPHFEKFPVHEDEHTAGTRFKKWIAMFNNLVTAMDLDDKPKRKKALLLHYAGEEVFDIYDTFTPAKKGGEDEAGFKTLVQSLAEHFEPKKHLDYEILKFRQARQEPNESMDSYVTRLRLLAATCEMGDNLERELKTQILQTCTSRRICRKAIRDEMTLDKILEYARSMEVADAQAKVVEAEREGNVNFVRRKDNKNQNRGAKKSDKTESDKSESQGCGWCGSKERHSKQSCPAKDRKCSACGLKGHFKNRQNGVFKRFLPILTIPRNPRDRAL